MFEWIRALLDPAEISNLREYVTPPPKFEEHANLSPKVELPPLKAVQDFAPSPNWFRGTSQRSISLGTKSTNSNSNAASDAGTEKSTKTEAREENISHLNTGTKSTTDPDGLAQALLERLENRALQIQKLQEQLNVRDKQHEQDQEEIQILQRRIQELTKTIESLSNDERVRSSSTPLGNSSLSTFQFRFGDAVPQL